MKKLSVILLLMSISFAGFSQIRHVAGIKSIEASYGYNKYGSSYNIGFVSFRSSEFYLKVMAFHADLSQDFGADNSINVGFQRTGIDLAGVYAPVSIQDMVYIGGVFGITGSHNRLSGESVDVSDKIKFGFLGGIEIEYYPIDKVSVVINGIQKYTFGDEYSNGRYYLNAGLRLNL